MIQIRWYARGGQGAKTASAMVAEAAVRGGRFAQGFPGYGAERQGAPTRAYNRVREKPVLEHDAVYEPDIVLVLDESLLDSQGVADGLRRDGVLVVNSREDPGRTRDRLGLDHGRVYAVDASGIAGEELGRPIPNTVMIGALARVSDAVSVDRATEEVRSKLSGKLDRASVEGNLRALDRASRELRGEDHG